MVSCIFSLQPIHCKLDHDTFPSCQESKPWNEPVFTSDFRWLLSSSSNSDRKIVAVLHPWILVNLDEIPTVFPRALEISKRSCLAVKDQYLTDCRLLWGRKFPSSLGARCRWSIIFGIWSELKLVNGGDPTGNEILQKVVWQPCDGMVSPTMFKHIQNSISKKWSWFWCLPFWTIAKCEHGSKSVTQNLSRSPLAYPSHESLEQHGPSPPAVLFSANRILLAIRVRLGSILESLKLQHDYKHYKPIYIYKPIYNSYNTTDCRSDRKKWQGFWKGATLASTNSALAKPSSM